MKHTGNKEEYQKMRERMLSLSITSLLEIDQDRDLLNLDTRRPDFGLYYEKKYIGIEVTEVRPHKIFNDKKVDLIAINKLLEELIRERLDDNKISAFRIEVTPNENIYYGIINKNDKYLINEINTHLIGNPVSHNYIERINIQQLNINGKNHIIPNKDIPIYIEWGGGMAITIPLEPVVSSIRKKEGLFENYLLENNHTFNELWLFITMPNEEHQFSFKGFVLPNDFSSKYDRIFVGQLFPPFANCIYRKSDNSENQ